MRQSHGHVRVAVVGLTVVTLASGVNAARPQRFGDPLPGLPRELLAEFAVGQDAFTEKEEATEGLGPVFNERSCVACHKSPATGGDSTIVETRFGTTTGGTFDPMTAHGGSLLQEHGIDRRGGCGGETVPPNATIVAKRKTTPLFGLGLVEAVPDATLLALAGRQRATNADVAGKPHVVTDVASGQRRVGRFGWKAQVATLLTFSADAYLNEMGFTSPMFPVENAPNGDAELLARCDANATTLDDDGDDVEAFAAFMRLLAPPPRGRIAADVEIGEQIFARIGCAICHEPSLTTGPHEVAALDRVTFQPFSDFLLHDMGSLGDGIHQGEATGREMRTAPLWGLRARETFLHDGRARTVQSAIRAHDGQGRAARDAFERLDALDTRKLLAFLKSL